MQVIIKIHLFRCPYTICSISDDEFHLPDEKCYKSIGVKTGDSCDIQAEDVKAISRNKLKLTASAFFLQPFVKECINSDVYRSNLLMNLNKLCRYPNNGLVYLKLILVPPETEIIDYAWNERMLRLIWTRVEIENAFSWLSTLGGAYSALGDYFEHCADEAGRISMRQYKLSKMLGDESLAARSKLYSAIAQAQKGNLRLSRHIVRNIALFAVTTRDKRLLRMCQGVWAKLKYLRSLKKIQEQEKGCLVNKKHDLDSGNGKVLTTVVS